MKKECVTQTRNEKKKLLFAKKATNVEYIVAKQMKYLTLNIDPRANNQ